MIIPLIRDSNSNQLMEKQLDHVIRHMERIAALSNNAADQKACFEANGSEDEFDYEVEDVVQVFKCSVYCLTGLLPSMERILALLDPNSSLR
jgi:hypothetical protein